MRGLRVFGDYAAEYLIISLLLIVSGALVVPLVPIYVGIIGFYKGDIDTRRFKDIFTTIGKNWKIIIKYTVFELVFMVFGVLNVYFFSSRPEGFNAVVLAASYVALVIGCVYFVNAPVIIVNMEVNLRQLIYDAIMLIFGGMWRSLISFAVLGGIVALIVLYPYLVLPALFFLPFVSSKLLKENFLRLKAKALNTSVFELKRRERLDDYVDEYGEVDHSSEEQSDDKVKEE